MCIYWNMFIYIQRERIYIYIYIYHKFTTTPKGFHEIIQLVYFVLLLRLSNQLISRIEERKIQTTSMHAWRLLSRSKWSSLWMKDKISLPNPKNQTKPPSIVVVKIQCNVLHLQIVQFFLSPANIYIYIQYNPFS